MKISNFDDFKLEKSNLITGGTYEEGSYQKTWVNCPDGQGQAEFKDRVD